MHGSTQRLGWARGLCLASLKVGKRSIRMPDNIHIVFLGTDEFPLKHPRTGLEESGAALVCSGLGRGPAPAPPRLHKKP